MTSGETLSAPDRRGFLRIGSQGIDYESRENDDTIHVVEVMRRPPCST